MVYVAIIANRDSTINYLAGNGWCEFVAYNADLVEILNDIRSRMKNFGQQLKAWRKTYGKSQLDLGLSADVSARHISFLETGRASPSRSMVHRIAKTLELPLRAENTLLGAAGFAPRYQERHLEHEDMDSARRALEFILKAHEPYPAFILYTPSSKFTLQKLTKTRSRTLTNNHRLHLYDPIELTPTFARQLGRKVGQLRAPLFLLTMRVPS